MLAKLGWSSSRCCQHWVMMGYLGRSSSLCSTMAVKDPLPGQHSKLSEALDSPWEGLAISPTLAMKSCTSWLVPRAEHIAQ